MNEIPDHIRQKFPHLQPVKRPPSLMTINGIGLGMYGRRDYDAETQTYVKTCCLCFVYIPLFALGSYRVADAGGRSWYFIGKEQLSGFARSCNYALGCLAVLLALGITWNVHTSSPEYRARQQMQRAAALVQAGQPLPAAEIYRQQLHGAAAAEAQKGFDDAIESCLRSDQPRIAASGLRLLAEASADTGRPIARPELFDRGMTLVRKFQTADTEGALEVLTVTAAFAPTNSSLPAVRIDLLKQIVAAAPDKTNRVIELAVAYEAGGQLEESWKLLRPRQHQLGDTEGARILGQKLLSEGQFADAYELLFPYVQTRLGKLHSAEASYTNLLGSISRQALDDLNHNRGPSDFYTRYEAAGKQQKEALVDEYIESRLRADPGMQRALAGLKQANEIVPVTLDLGIVQLNRAQGLNDPAARKSELEAAEKTFLAIRSFAGESDEYRMFLGQVYYWLGRSKEGRELFDQLLASRRRAYPTLMQLSHTLRMVGEMADARALAEEAYRTAGSDKERFEAAAFRSLLLKDRNDQIAWLEKADPNSAAIQTELNSARGTKALGDGNKTLAADYLRKAISGYQGQTKSAASLNNCGLAHFNLYEATGNLEDHKHGLDLMEEAITLDPSDSILLHNTTYCLFNRAVMDVLNNAIRVELLGEQGELGMLSHLYQNEQGRTPVYQQLANNEAMKKGLAYLDKALVLAPKDVGLYATALSLQSAFRNLPELQKLDQRLHVAAPDLAEIRQETLRAYTGAEDKESLDNLLKRIRALEDLARTPAVSEHLLTLERVNVSLILLRERAWTQGGFTDGQGLLQSALATHEKHASSATRYALISASLFRASEELVKQNVEYAAWASRTRHSLSSEQLLGFVLEHGGPIADQARHNPNVARAVALEKQGAENFPSLVTIEEWAVLRNTEPATAAVIASRIKQDEATQLIDRLQFQLNPVSAGIVLEQYWMQKMLGDEKRGVEIYQTAVRDGVPLPPL